MRRFLELFSYKFQQFMYGRYGFDELSKMLMIASVVCVVISSSEILKALYFIGCLLMFFAYFRVFSRNLSSRRKELEDYFRLKTKIIKKISLIKRKSADKNTHKYFKCKTCGAVMRVPKGKGKIEITCSVCKKKMIKKT